VCDKRKAARAETDSLPEETRDDLEDIETLAVALEQAVARFVVPDELESMPNVTAVVAAVRGYFESMSRNACALCGCRMKERWPDKVEAVTAEIESRQKQLESEDAEPSVPVDKKLN